MKKKLLIIAMLLFSALGFSQHQVEIRGNKFYLTDTSDPNDKVEGDNQYDVEAKEGRGGRIFLFSNDRRIHSPVGYDWTEFLDPTGNPFASKDAVFAWFDVNTGNKSGGGSTSGQTAPQVQAAIDLDQTNVIRADGVATDDKSASEKAVRDALIEKIPDGGTPLQLLRVKADGTGTEWYSENPVVNEWIGGSVYQVTDQVVSPAPIGVTETEGVNYFIQPKAANAPLTAAAVMDATEWEKYDVIAQAPRRDFYTISNVEVNGNLNYESTDYQENVLKRYIGGIDGGTVTVLNNAETTSFIGIDMGRSVWVNPMTTNYVVKLGQGDRLDLGWDGTRIFFYKYSAASAWQTITEVSYDFDHINRRRVVFPGAMIRFNGTTTATNIGQTVYNAINPEQTVTFFNDGATALTWNMPNRDGTADTTLEPGEIVTYRYIETPVNGYQWIMMQKTGLDGGSASLSLLDDVDNTGLSANDFLVYDGTEFKPQLFVKPMAFIDTQVEYDALSTEQKQAADYVIGDSGSIGGGGNVGTDDQTSGEVPFTPASGIVATNTQAAIEEVKNSITDDQTGAEVALTGYVKPTDIDAVADTDTTNEAIGKLERALDDKEDALNYENKFSLNPELYIYQDAATFPPNQYPKVYDFSNDGFGVLNNAQVTAVKETENGIGDYVINVTGDGATNSPTWRFVPGTENGKNYHFDIRIRFLSGNGQVVSLAGTAPAIDVDLATETDNPWRWISFDAADNGSNPAGIVMAVQGFQNNSTFQVKVSVKEK